MKSILCIYHGNCADGFTAAWVLRNHFGEENVDFFPGFYGKPPPQNLSQYETVYLVDFSYKRDVILKMVNELVDNDQYAPASMYKKIVIIDHHKTAQADLVALPENVEVNFDMEHSGAMLVWKYFNGHVPSCNAPDLIQRVEDRDLWRFKFSDTREVAAKMFSHEYTFENWDRMAEEYNPQDKFSALTDIFLAEGAAIERKHFKDINEMLALTKDRAEILDWNIPIANLPYIYSSDAGHIMAEGEHFAACYWYEKDRVVFSLRSSEEKVDVSEIARQFGGGGHRNAAGFNLTFEQYWSALADRKIRLSHDYFDNEDKNK